MININELCVSIKFCLASVWCDRRRERLTHKYHHELGPTLHWIVRAVAAGQIIFIGIDCGSVAERSKVSNSGSNGCEFDPRARTSVLRWPLNANFHRLSRSRCYFVELRCRWFCTKAASACSLLETIDRVYPWRFTG